MDEEVDGFCEFGGFIVGRKRIMIIDFPSQFRVFGPCGNDEFIDPIEPYLSFTFGRETDSDIKTHPLSLSDCGSSLGAERGESADR